MPPEDAALCWLTEEERARAERFHTAGHRIRYLAAHVALRRLVAERSGIAPERQQYEQGALGKWRLAGNTDWQFSLSYTGRAALIGLARGEAVGVDLEAERAIEDADDLAAEFFDGGERARYDRLTGADRTAAFLRGWTRKEACLKAIGVGLSLPPAAVHTGLDGVRRVVVAGSAVDVGSFRYDGMIGAWARKRSV